MKIELESKLEQLATVEKLVDSIAEKVSIEGDVYANILIGVTEAVTNAIVHGNKLDSSKSVTVEYFWNEKSIQFVITDLGDGFNYYSVPDPTLPENIEKEDVVIM